MNRYGHIVAMPDPLRAIRAMTDHGLSALIDELREVKQANEFHTRLFAVAMSEAVLRWRGGLGDTVETKES